jgi:hypothetical protein
LVEEGVPLVEERVPLVGRKSSFKRKNPSFEHVQPKRRTSPPGKSTQLPRRLVRQTCVSSTTSLRGRSGSVAAAALIGIGLTILVEQVVHLDNPGLFLLAFGAALLFAYFNQPHQTSNLIVVGGVLSGLGLGCLLSSHDLTPEYLHGALTAGSLALGFGAVFLLGDAQRHHWAIWPAAGLAIVAWLSFVTQAPWLKDTFGQLFHVTWPLLLVAAGLWLIQRSRTSADRPD